ncbi:hypothetical protein [Catellatospora vulcania]|uniref:hypothetical protein n=1 Tax=Catellatospora vulcania TaxID=1460450 RepID=UPI0012D43256|nr:hypothetical protein [Catellatospora vulcania]
MGIHLVDIGPDSWAQDEITSGIRVLLDRALAERGLGPYPGPPREAPPEESFEEKISPTPFNGRSRTPPCLCATSPATGAHGVRNQAVVPSVSARRVRRRSRL